jgi:serine/threonine protein kinase
VLSDAVSSDELVGTRIGRFEILARQGRGQFGVVYRARDTQLGRLVAVKIMRRAGPGGPRHASGAVSHRGRGGGAPAAPEHRHAARFRSSTARRT